VVTVFLINPHTLHIWGCAMFFSVIPRSDGFRRHILTLPSSPHCAPSTTRALLILVPDYSRVETLLE